MDTKALLKQHVVPALRERGFRGSFPHFRRTVAEGGQLLTFQLDRLGSGNYVIELAKVPPGPFHMPWGELVEPQKLTAHHVNVRHRLGAGSGEDYWFQARALQDRPSQEAVALMSLLDTEGQAWWRAGPNNSSKPTPLRGAA